MLYALYALTLRIEKGHNYSSHGGHQDDKLVGKTKTCVSDEVAVRNEALLVGDLHIVLRYKGREEVWEERKMGNPEPVEEKVASFFELGGCELEEVADLSKVEGM